MVKRKKTETMSQEVFFTADTHFGHTNIIEFCNRPFATVEDMNERLIENWNIFIKNKDIVYHLGDFAWRKPHEVIDRLNGQIHLILGNHDYGRLNLEMKAKFRSVSDIKICRTVEPHIMLSHYAMRSWYRAQHGVGHLFGHSHGKLPPHGKSFDIGVDCWNYSPVPYDMVRDKMETLEALSKEQL